MPNPLSSYFLCFLFTCHISFMLNPKIISLITDFKKKLQEFYLIIVHLHFCRNLVVLSHFLMRHGMPNDHLSCFFFPVFFPMYIHSCFFLTASVQYVPQIHTRDVCPEAIPDFSKAQAVCEAEAISYRFYNLSLRRRGR